jgi:hypothetical protein
LNGWVAVLLLAVALSPLAWLAPSRREKAAMGLRMQARRMGLAMQLVRRNWPHWLPLEPPGSCAQYYRLRRKGRTDAWRCWQIARGEWVNDWREPLDDAALLEHLQGLPADVFMVEADPQVVSLYWGERGVQSDLDSVSRVLERLA